MRSVPARPGGTKKKDDSYSLGGPESTAEQWVEVGREAWGLNVG
jgi:hypothetical protein